MEDKPRYSRNSDIIELAFAMASRPQGITIKEIEEEYGVSRRTAERMRDSLINIFPQIEELEIDEQYNTKHWGFTNHALLPLISFTPKEIANIEQYERRTTNKEVKSELKKTVDKIKLLSQKRNNTIENNIELYMQTEGYAIRQMPQYKMNLEHLGIVREALKDSKMVSAVYHEKQRKLEPLGLIYGEKVYLVAREKAKGDGIYNYLLHKFTDFKLTDETFDKGDFDLQKYSSRSFGVYQGEVLSVKLLFNQELAEDASKYNFHPTQKGKYNEDGTYTVTFKASGSREIIWHVFKWGAGCKILSPKSLRDEYKKYLVENVENY
jgi:predicted DNA-binding transcriptional regulator YafY